MARCLTSRTIGYLKSKMENDVKNISMDLIDDPALAMRENVEDEEIDALMASIRQVGLLEPLVVRSVADRFELIAGHRRLTAMRRLGKVICQAKILDVDSNTALTVRIHENSHRENVNPVDEAVYIGRVMAQLEISAIEMAEKMNRSPGYIYDRLAILEFPEYLIGPVAEKKISISAAIALNKIKDETTKRNFVEIAAKDGITLERANAWVSMVDLGIITPDTTSDQIQAMEEPAVYNEVSIKCARCEASAPIKQMVTVWIHKECPQAESPTA